MQLASSKSTGLTFLDFATCASAALTTYHESILSRAASRARTSARPVLAPASLEPDRDSGLSSLASFASYDRATRSWRTSQICFTEQMELGLVAFSETWPKSGMMRNGDAFQRAPLAPRIGENGYSLWPTPTANMGIASGFSIGQHIKQLRRNQRDGYQTGDASGLLISRVADEFDAYPTAEFVEWLMGFPVGWSDIED